MTDKRDEGFDWMVAVDERILDYLHEEQPDYAPLIASRLGVHLKYVERRCETLEENGLIEPISGEVVYRITALGVRYLDAVESSDRAESGEGEVRGRPARVEGNRSAS